MFARKFYSSIGLAVIWSLLIPGCLTLGEDVFYDPPKWSPKSDRIAFAALHGENWDIYRVNVDGTGLTQLTNSPELDRYPDWSPDGQQIVFVSYRDRPPQDCCGDIYVMQADGSKVTRLTQDAYFPSFPKWSPDGKQIVFVANDEIYVINSDGSKRTKLVGNKDKNGQLVINSSPVWSPDGKKIAFGSNGISVINADGSDRINLSNDSDDYAPSWSPDSKKILYTKTKMAGDAKNLQAIDRNIWIADIQGANPPKKLAEGSDPTWLANGQKIAFTCEADKNSNKWNICFINSDGSNLTELDANGSFFTWSPNGRKIAFHYSEREEIEIYTMNSDGSGLTQLTKHKKY
ncbi:MAG: PD40 domain-containing protein [Cyanosarcina radialis HA8281-LM2]|jgi:TolB protein|nr:PD40 domain-containing protein [Cyanosarcina radialis HA8281-LM2]